MCFLVPRQAIFGQDGEQFVANGFLCRCVFILTHLVRVGGLVAKIERCGGCQRMTMDAPLASTQQIIKTKLWRAERVLCIHGPPRTSSRCLRPVPWVSAIRRHRPPPQNASRKLHIRLQTLNLLFDRWIMWKKSPAPVGALGLCRNAISRPRRDKGMEAMMTRLRHSWKPCTDL